MTDLRNALLTVAVAPPVALALAVLPAPALLAWTLLGAVAGVLAGGWAWLVGAPAVPRAALATSAATTAAGLALAGGAVALGPATPAILATLVVLTGLARTGTRPRSTAPNASAVAARFGHSSHTGCGAAHRAGPVCERAARVRAQPTGCGRVRRGSPARAAAPGRPR